MCIFGELALDCFTCLQVKTVGGRGGGSLGETTRRILYVCIGKSLALVMNWNGVHGKEEMKKTKLQLVIKRKHDL